MKDNHVLPRVKEEKDWKSQLQLAATSSFEMAGCGRLKILNEASELAVGGEEVETKASVPLSHLAVQGRREAGTRKRGLRVRTILSLLPVTPEEGALRERGEWVSTS